MWLVAVYLCASALAPADDADVAARLHFIEQHLASETPAAQAWFGLWTAVYGGLTVGQAVELAVTHDPVVKHAALVGGIGGLVGALSMVALPMPAAFAAHRLRNVPARTPEERRDKLALAERLLADAAAGEIFEKSWVVQLSGFAVSTALGLILALAYHDWRNGLINELIGVGVAQAQVTSSPLQAVRDREAYAREFGLHLPETKTFFWHFDVYPGGLGASGTF